MKLMIIASILAMAGSVFAKTPVQMELKDCTNTSGEIVWAHPPIMVPPAPKQGEDKYASLRPQMETYEERMKQCNELRAQVNCSDVQVAQRTELIFLFLNRTKLSANDAKKAAMYSAENMVCADHKNI